MCEGAHKAELGMSQPDRLMPHRLSTARCAAKTSVRARLGKVDWPLELGAAVAAFFRRGLGLDQPAIGGHHHIHVHFGLGILLITEVQKRGAADDAHRGGGDELF